MKIVIIGDIHGRSSWQQIIAENPDSNYFFLGDYLDPYKREEISHIEALENFEKIIDFKKANPKNTTLLLGNHDIQYLYYPKYKINDEDCYTQDNIDIFTKNKDLFTYIVQINNHIICHAGISNGWFNKYVDFFKFFGLRNDFSNLADIINLIGCNEKWQHILFTISPFRNGHDDFGGIVWADKYELYEDYLTGFHQYVGHSKQKNITIIGNSTSSITFCDILWNLTAPYAYVKDLL